MAVSFYAGTPETSERKYHYTQPFRLCGEENERTKDRTLEHPPDEEHILGNFRPFFFICGTADLICLAASTGTRENRGQKKKEKEKEKEIQPSKDSRDKARRQIEQGILETAATDSRYSHLLNKEEEAIVKDVIKEFLT